MSYGAFGFNGSVTPTTVEDAVVRGIKRTTIEDSVPEIGGGVDISLIHEGLGPTFKLRRLKAADGLVVSDDLGYISLTAPAIGQEIADRQQAVGDLLDQLSQVDTNLGIAIDDVVEANQDTQAQLDNLQTTVETNFQQLDGRIDDLLANVDQTALNSLAELVADYQANGASLDTKFTNLIAAQSQYNTASGVDVFFVNGENKIAVVGGNSNVSVGVHAMRRGTQVTVAIDPFTVTMTGSDKTGVQLSNMAVLGDDYLPSVTTPPAIYTIPFRAFIHENGQMSDGVLLIKSTGEILLKRDDTPFAAGTTFGIANRQFFTFYRM